MAERKKYLIPAGVAGTAVICCAGGIAAGLVGSELLKGNGTTLVVGPDKKPASTPTPNATATILTQFQEWQKTREAQIATGTPPPIAREVTPAAPTRVAIRTATAAVRQPVYSCDFVTNESLSRAVVFEGFPARAIQVLTTDTAQQKNFFKTSDWNRNAALNLGFAEPGGLSDAGRFEKVTTSPYSFSVGLQEWAKVFLQEGTLTWATADGTTRKVVLPEKQGRTFGVYLRGLYNERGNKPVNVNLKCNVADHGQVHHISVPNTAFVSEGQLGQESVSVFTGKNFDGNAFTIPNDNTARDEFTVVVVDMNTGAYTVADQKAKGAPFQLESQNWK